MSTPNIFTSAPTQSHTAVSSGMDGAQQTEGETLFQQASQSHQPEVLVKRQFERRNQNQKSKLANEFIASAGREGISQLAATPDGQHALAVVYDHAGSDGRGMMRQAHEEQGTTAVDYTGKEAETGKEMDSGSVSLQNTAPKSKHNQQLVELINSRSAEIGLSINLSDQASPAEINQASETINSVIKYDQQTFGTVLTTEKMSLLNEYIEQQNSDLPPIAYSGDEQKYAPIKPIIEKIDQLKSESNHENGFFDRLDQNINKSASFKPLFQSQSTGQPVVDALIATSDAILNLPTTAANLALVTANSPAIVLSAATGDSLEKTEMDIIGAAMSVSPQLEGLAQLSTVRRAIGLTTANTTSLSSSRLSEGGRKVSDFLEKSFAGRLKRDGDTTIQTERVVGQAELKLDAEIGQMVGGEGVGARNSASLGTENSVTMKGSVSAPDKFLPPRNKAFLARSELDTLEHLSSERTALGLTSGSSLRKNLAVAEFNINGETGVLRALSKEPKPGRLGANLVEIPDPSNRVFTTSVVDDIDRAFDSEVKILETIAAKYDPATAKGTINLSSELWNCGSCQGVIKQFSERFKGIEINSKAGPFQNKMLQKQANIPLLYKGQ